MRLTRMSRCATRAVFDLAYHANGLPIQAKAVALRQDIPLRFLEQIFHKLKHAEVVKSVKGPHGGYMLARDPQAITVGEIIRTVKEPLSIVHCVSDAARCSRAPQCITRLVWKEASAVLNTFFDSVKISDLCERGKAMGLQKA